MEAIMQARAEKSNKRAQIQTYKLYFESKIACLTNKRLPASLHMLACKDAPYEPGTLGSNWQRSRYVKKCLRYYKKKLKELEKELKKIK